MAKRGYADRSGRVYGRLTVLSPYGVSKHNDKLWLCRCECGTEKVFTSNHLTKSKREKMGISCGCLRADRNRERGIANRKHGHSSRGRVTKEYTAFFAARARCRNPKNCHFPNYGGRGIEFRFESFAQWFAELGPKPGPGYSVDRIETNGHYEPGNVRWATAVEQRANQRKK
jgi:hypothetical protein